MLKILQSEFVLRLAGFPAHGNHHRCGRKPTGFPYRRRTLSAALQQRLSVIGGSCQGKGKSTRFVSEVLYMDSLTGNCLFTL